MICAESLFILLMGSYYDVMTGENQKESLTYEWALNAAHATQLSRIADRVFQKTGWVAACARLNLQGINVTTPFSEKLHHERSLWVRQDGPGFMTFRKPQTPLYDDNRGLAVNIHHDLNTDIPASKLDHLGALKPKAIVSLVVEIITDGRIHSRQFGRLPFVGPYSDWQDCLGFAVRIEFMTSKGKSISKHLLPLA